MVKTIRTQTKTERNQIRSSPSHVISVRHFQLWYEVL